MKTLIFIISSALIVYLLFALLLYFYQRNLIYFPSAVNNYGFTLRVIF